MFHVLVVVLVGGPLLFLAVLGAGLARVSAAAEERGQRLAAIRRRDVERERMRADRRELVDA